MRFTLLLFAALITFSGIQAIAQDEAKQSTAKTQGGGDLRAAVQNPVGAMYSLPFKFTFDYGAPNGEASFLNIQPVIPITVGDWNLINRIIAPLIDSPGEVAGTPGIPNPISGNGATGLGDINYSLFLSPAKPKGAIWGIGPSITMPTATDEELGQRKMECRADGCGPLSAQMGNYRGARQAFGVICRRFRSQEYQPIVV